MRLFKKPSESGFFLFCTLSDWIDFLKSITCSSNASGFYLRVILSPVNFSQFRAIASFAHNSRTVVHNSAQLRATEFRLETLLTYYIGYITFVQIQAKSLLWFCDLATRTYFLICISLQHDAVNHSYFELWILLNQKYQR